MTKETNLYCGSSRDRSRCESLLDEVTLLSRSLSRCGGGVGSLDSTAIWASFSSISLSLAAVSTGLAPPKIAAFASGALVPGGTGTVRGASFNFGLSRGASGTCGDSDRGGGRSRCSRSSDGGRLQEARNLIKVEVNLHNTSSAHIYQK